MYGARIAPASEESRVNARKSATIHESIERYFFERELETKLPPLSNGVTFFGRYKITGFIGRGGISDVYAAVDQQDGLEVVLKRLPRTTEPLYLARYVDREVKMSAVLKNTGIPGLIKIKDILQNESEFCVVLTDPPKHTLYDMTIQNGVIPTRQAIEITISICETLRQLHELRIVHCDIKPRNIVMLSPTEPIVTDLGTARYYDERLQPEEIVLTPIYAPRELTTGDPVDGRVDIYSLGITLIHLLTGIPNEIKDDVLGSGPVFLGDVEIPAPSAIILSPTEIERSLNEVRGKQLRRILSIAVMPDPAYRYKNIAAFADRLQTYLNREQMSAEGIVA